MTVKCTWAVEGVKMATCNCPIAYNRCIKWVRWDEAHGDYSRGHGGWGWKDPEAAKRAIAAKHEVGMAKLARGLRFTHDRFLDPEWKPSPGQHYADAPKAECVVTRVTKTDVFYCYAGDARGGWVVDRDDFVARFLP